MHSWSERLGDETPANSVRFFFIFIGVVVNIRRTILCECGEFVGGRTFKEYIKTTANPSTATIGHKDCGLIFNFIDDKFPKRYSSKSELKSLALKFAEMNKLHPELICEFLLEVDRLKSAGNQSDMEILILSYKKIEAAIQNLV